MPLDKPDHPHASTDLGAPEARARLNAIAHDFNNVLTVINGYSDLLLKQLDEGDAREQVAEIRQAGARASDLTRQFLEIVRQAPAEVGPSLDAAMAPAIAPAAPPPDLPPASPGETVLLVEDQPEVRRVATRVLVRCGYQVIDAASADEAVEQAERFEGPIHLLVTDMVLPGTNGRELAARLAASRPGLKVLFVSGYSREHLLAHQWLDPDSSFLAKPFQTHALAAAVRSALPRPRRATVLVVDDEEGLRKLLCGVLVSAGYEALSAVDGREAQRVVRSCAVDLVLMDLVMPNREGLETVSELRRECPSLKIVAMSGFGDTFLQIAKRLGARATLAKPIAPDDLLRVVEKTLGAP